MKPLDELQRIDMEFSRLSAELPRPSQMGNPDLALEERQRLHLEALDQHLALLEPIVATLRQAQFVAETQLRLHDKTLTEDVRPVVDALLEQPPTVEIKLLHLQLPAIEQRITLAGVWCAQVSEGPVLSYCAAGGLETYADLESMRLEFAERLDDGSQARPIRARLAKNDRARIGDAVRLQFTPLSARGLFLHEAIEGLRLLRKTVLAVWRQLRRNPPELMSQFDERMAPALDLVEPLGSEPRVQTRYAALLAQRMPTWMKGLPIQRLTHLVQTMQEVALAHQQAAAPGLLTLEQFNRKQDLIWYARRELRFALEYGYGRRLDPDQLFVTVVTGEPQGPISIPFPPHSHIPGWLKPKFDKAVAIRTTRYTLTELSLENVGRFDLRFWLTARVHDAQGKPVGWISPAQVKQMVRTLNLADSYERFLRYQLLDSPAGQWREEAYARLLRARMRTEAVKAHYSGILDEIGYRWAMAIIDHPDPVQRGLVLGHRLEVSQVQINRSTLQGVLLIGPEQQSALRRRLLYLPDSPLRQPWLMCTDNRDVAHVLLGDPDLFSYVLQRLPPSDRKSVARLLVARRAGPLLSTAPIPGPLFAEMYRSEARFWIAHTHAVATATGRIDRQTAWKGTLLLIELISLVLPQRALAPLSLGRSFWSIWDGISGAEDQDLETTLRHFAEGLNHGIAAIGPMTSGNRIIRRALRQGRPPAVLSINVGAGGDVMKGNVRYRLEDEHAVQEASDTDDGVRQYYIEGPHGRRYRVEHDGERWRVQDSRLPSAYLKIPIRKDEAGHWVPDSPLRWDEGLPDIAGLIRLNPATLPTDAGAWSNDGHLEAGGRHFLRLGSHIVAVRRSLVPGHWRLLLESAHPDIGLTVTLRVEDGRWVARARQKGRSSDWLALGIGAQPG